MTLPVVPREDRAATKVGRGTRRRLPDKDRLVVSGHRGGAHALGVRIIETQQRHVPCQQAARFPDNEVEGLLAFLDAQNAGGHLVQRPGTRFPPSDLIKGVAEILPHAVERLGKHADLILSMDLDRRHEVTGSDPLGLAGKHPQGGDDAAYIEPRHGAADEQHEQPDGQGQRAQPQGQRDHHVAGLLHRHTPSWQGGQRCVCDVMVEAVIG